VIGFGLDLAGYTTNKTCLSAVEANGKTAHATLLSGTVFSLPHKSSSRLGPILAEEVRIINDCAKRGSVAVDVPIDLQSLVRSELPEQIWALTCRPVDKELRALRPLADRLGSAVARFKAIRAAEGFEPILGKNLFETYPAASLRASGCSTKHYKQDTEAGEQARSAICQRLNFDVLDLTDDEIDSIVCALAAVERAEDAPLPCNQMPKGYVLLKTPFPFKKVSVRRKSFAEWMKLSDRK
jgi:predicted nuclease with RNAse H fold